MIFNKIIFYLLFQYIPNNILTSNSLIDDFESIPLPCDCEKTCDFSCSCGLGSDIAYKNDILLEEFVNESSKPIVECSDLCNCKSCPNRIVQNGIKILLQVFMTEYKGFGVQTVEFIPKLTFVCEYAGELIDKFEAQIRMNKRSSKEPNYIFVLNEYNSEFSNICTVIDPTFYGNVGRYLNHSCSPNLVPVPVRANSMIPRICFFAKRDIMPYEELTYLYGGNIYQENDCTYESDSKREIIKKKCFCNTEHCVGVLPFDDNWMY